MNPDELSSLDLFLLDQEQRFDLGLTMAHPKEIFRRFREAIEHAEDLEDRISELQTELEDEQDRTDIDIATTAWAEIWRDYLAAFLAEPANDVGARRRRL